MLFSVRLNNNGFATLASTLLLAETEQRPWPLPETRPIYTYFRRHQSHGGAVVTARCKYACNPLATTVT